MSPILLSRILCVIALYGLCSSAFSADVTTAALLGEMIDLGRLCTTSSPAYKTVQFSSYDRRADLPSGPGWFSNADGFGGEPIPGVLRTIQAADASGVGVYVLAECDGPGAIVRCWSAARHRTWLGMNGDIRLYLDGAKEPVFSGTARDFLIDLYAAIARRYGISEEGLTEGFTQRDACYCPIPFAKGCRIEWTGKLAEVHFYHIELRRYAPDTEVETFQPKMLDSLRPELNRVGAVLANPSLADPPADAETAPFSLSLAPGESRSVVEVQGRAARIVRFLAKLTAEDLDAALRQTVLLVTFDRHARPQVESPLGDFFGAAPGVNPYDSIPMKVEPDGTMLCRFEMPFADAVDVRLENRGGNPVEISGKVLLVPCEWDSERSCHFHARWRVDHEMQVHGMKGFDVPFLIAQGRGRFVGVSVHLMNPDGVPSCNWWGEGDEKVFVHDGFSYGRISYFYARPGLRDDSLPVFRESLRRPEAPRNWEPSRSGRQENATFFHVSDLKPDAGLVDKDPRWARGERILFKPKEPGDSIAFEFDVPKASAYHMSVVASHAPSAGICEVFVNGKPAGTFDTFTPFFTMEREHVLGRVELKEGKNEIRFTGRGKNEKRAGGEIGVDFFWIQP